MTQSPSATDQIDGQHVLSVSALTAQIKDVVEGSFPGVWVAGEISNFSRPQSGHCYFTLKDDKAQIRAVVWRGTVNRIDFELEDGQEVICQGHLDVYAPRGSYQLVVTTMLHRGLGGLQLALRRLREKLAAEGLFDPVRKRPLPRFPRRIGIVTSPTGAAIHDFLEVLRRRWRGVHVLLLPAAVQGNGAASQIAAQIASAARLAPALDVLVVGRGGGSMEDLWSFNDERVVRAIAACPIPVVSAVGHEIDVTLSDLVADVRALTPSEAAERVVPAANEITVLLAGFRQRLTAVTRARLQAAQARLDAIAARRSLREPLGRVHECQRRLDELSDRCERALRNRAAAARAHLDRMAGKLESLSPLAVLGRGYSVTVRQRDGQLLRDASQVAIGEQIETRLSGGRLVSDVRSIIQGET